jgi:hypothetical protein
MPLPAVGIAAGLLPAIGQLFGVGRPDTPSYDPKQIQALIAQYYKMLLGGPIGQGMTNQANLGANQFQNSLAAAGARSGLSSTGLGQIAGAGASSLAASGRMGVQSDLLQRAQELAFKTLSGQTAHGEFNALHPSGLQAFLGSLGTSAYPLLLGQNGQKGPVNSNPMPNYGGNPGGTWGNPGRTPPFYPGY